MKKSDAEELLEKYRSGACTPEERDIVESYIIHRGITPFDLKEMQTDIEELRAKVVKIPFRSKIVNWPLRIVFSTAALVILLGIWTLLFVKNSSIPLYQNDINPGANRATITLSNGKKINLSNTKAGVIIGASSFKYNDGSEVELGDLRSAEQTTIATPRGGQYYITLPDGSKVWLNAASSLTYRASFNERGVERIVTLSGEAYFEISKDKNRPFIVKSKLQEVEVLGTHFNISAYADENGVKTTLLEGSVKVAERGNTQILKPNQQSVITANNAIKVEEVDAINAIAWKNGEFSFRNEPLESIMRKVARWYNVEVVYENKELAAIPFGGSISRFGKVSEVLCMLQLTGKVKFKIEGRKVIVN